ncbi:hypothetical protein ILYODFUR_032033 [Ilyodon furcidens]|uniref:Uncharacterized protein n=1 Tax=Ilyodon furcidens TaxID=33524 RepID=A0ABV0UX40_9TELE
MLSSPCGPLHLQTYPCRSSQETSSLCARPGSDPAAPQPQNELQGAFVIQFGWANSTVDPSTATENSCTASPFVNVHTSMTGQLHLLNSLPTGRLFHSTVHVRGGVWAEKI